MYSCIHVDVCHANVSCVSWSHHISALLLCSSLPFPHFLLTAVVRGRAAVKNEPSQVCCSVGERKWKEEGEVFNSLIHREEGSILTGLLYFTVN